MGILIDQAIRLLRTKWQSAQLLAEELFAIFQSDRPIKMDSPLEITVEDDQAPLTVRDFGDGDFIIKIEGPDGFTGGIAIDDGGLTFVDEEGNPQDGGDDGDDEDDDQAGGGIPGKVIAQVSGANYSVELYENGPANPSTRTVSVTQLQIASEEVIPNDTWAIVTSQTVNGVEVFSMQVPVWLA